MSCCCTYTYDLGCVSNCGILEMTDLLAPSTGTYTLEIDAKYAVWNKTFSATINQPFEVNLSIFNEAEQIVFKIKKPDGTYYEYTDSPYDYDCFTVQTSVTQTYEST